MQKLNLRRKEIKILRNIVFGKRSERRKEVSIGKKRQGAVIGHKGKGRKIPEGLAIKEEIIEILEEKRFCPLCGLPYQEIGIEEVSDEVCVEKVYYTKRHAILLVRL